MRYALVGAGSVGNSFIADLPHLARDLGAVAAASFRLASRTANTLGAGVPVRNMDALDGSRTILICAAGRSFGDVFGNLRDAKVNWSRKTLLVCDSDRYSNSLGEFQGRGAAVGSINSLGSLPDRFVVEGDLLAVRCAKYLARELGGRTVELKAARVLSYGAAVTFSTSLFTPLVESCMQCLSDAGITGMNAGRIAESMFERSLRTYRHAGRKSWTGPVASGDAAELGEEIRRLCEWTPLLAEYYRTSSVFALELFRRHPDLAAALKSDGVARPRPSRR